MVTQTIPLSSLSKAYRSAHKFFCILVALLAVLASNDAAALSVGASLDRNPIGANETVRLIVEADERLSNQSPDLSPLEQDFDVLHTSTSTQVNIINGRQAAKTQWLVELAPKREGNLVVPPITIGDQQTQALTLKVLAVTTQQADDTQDIFLEVEVEPDTPYVQSQMVYTLRLFHAVNLLDGTLDEPAPQDTVVERLGKDVSFEAHRNGRRYRVIERKYAIFPQASGDLVIPPLGFQGQIADASQRQFGLSGFFDRGRTVRLQTETINVKVRPQPTEYGATTWLPADELTLKESWSVNPLQFRVGEPVTRTLTIEARGLSGVQLPEVLAPTVEGVRTYPDQATTDSRQEGTLIIGTRQERMAVVPTRSGELTLPEIQLSWWDVTRDEARRATIPARRINILPALGENTPQSTSLDVTDAKTTVTVEATPITTASKDSKLLWQGLSAALFSAWLITLFAWWRSRTSTSAETDGPAEPAPLPTAREALRCACSRDDPLAAKAALIDCA
ncbi:MAG: BatD family protein, partial [Gammaproteobacteria bacterium]|nr:BatD family protein [Gammaproteobacteria bacterium]